MYKSVKDLVLELEPSMENPIPIQQSPGDTVRNVPTLGMSEWRRLPWGRVNNTFILVGENMQMTVKHCDLRYVQVTIEDGISWTLVAYQGRKATWREERYYLYKIIQDPLEESAYTYYLRAAVTMPEYRKEWRTAGKQLLRRAPRDEEIVFRGQHGQQHDQAAQRELAQRLTEHDSDGSFIQQQRGGERSDDNPAHLYENETTDSRVSSPIRQYEARGLDRALSQEGQELVRSPLTRAATAAIQGFQEAAAAQEHQAAATDPARQIGEMAEQLSIEKIKNDALKAELLQAQSQGSKLREECRRMREYNDRATQKMTHLESLIDRVRTLENGIDRALKAQDDPGQDFGSRHQEVRSRQIYRQPSRRASRINHRQDPSSSDSESEYFRGRRRSPSANARGRRILSDLPHSTEKENNTGARPKIWNQPGQIAMNHDPVYQPAYTGQLDRISDTHIIHTSTTPGRSPHRHPRTRRSTQPHTQTYIQPFQTQQIHTQQPYALPRPLTSGPRQNTAAAAAEAQLELGNRNLSQGTYSQNAVRNPVSYTQGQDDNVSQNNIAQQALLTVVENLTTLITQNTSNNAHNTANKFPKGFVTFYGGRTGVHIETFFQRAEAIMPPTMSDAEKICMIIANIDKNPDTQGIVQDNWTGTYSQFKEWLNHLYKDIRPCTTISHWAQISRKKYTKFNQWQSENTKLVNLTLNKWPQLGPAEKHLVMEGLANIAPKAALAKFKIGNRFSDEVLRTTPFMDILIHIGEHNENYEFTEWSCFDRTKLRQPAVQIGQIESTNQNKDHTYKSFKDRKFHRNYRQNPRQNLNQDQHNQHTHTTQNQQTQQKNQQQNNNPSQQTTGSSYTPKNRGQRSSFPRDPTGTCIYHGPGHRTEQCVTGLTRAQAESQNGRGRGNNTSGNGLPNQTPGYNQTRANTQSTSNPTQNSQQRGGRGNFRGRGRGYNNNRGRGGYGDRQVNSISQEGHLPLPEPQQHTGPQQQNFQTSPQAPSTTLGIIQTNPLN